MPQSLDNWLASLGLEEYADVFRDNAVDEEVLPELAESDLEKLGVKLGHRKKLLKAITSLSPQSAEPQVQAAPGPTDENPVAAWERMPGERKPVTLLFADITGSTALTEKLDSEETHELLYGATRCICKAVESNRGTVCRLMGDGAMAMFGAPVAEEFHAVYACQAALDMLQSVQDFSKDVEARHGVTLQIRVGVHSGEVMVLTVGEGDHVEHDATGPNVPIAARMEQTAEPGTCVITQQTRGLAGDRIEAEHRDPVHVKGISQPVPNYVLRATRSSADHPTQNWRTAFVGRKGELAQFEGIVMAGLTVGEGHTVYVRGPAGIGKTRLLSEFAAVACARSFTCHKGLILDFGAGRGEDAIGTVVRSLLGLKVRSGVQERIDAAATAVASGLLTSDQRVFLNDLLDIPQPVDTRALYDAMDNATRNTGKRKVVTTLINRISANQPLLVIIEDVHWADKWTLAHVAEICKTVADCPAVLLMTSRVEGDPLDQRWRGVTLNAPFTTLDLSPLRPREATAMAGELFADVNDNVDDWMLRCIERSEGNPLFLEQLLASGGDQFDESLPDSIQSIVHARMDRLDPPARRALQAASVIGQRFELGAVHHLIDDEGYDCSVLVEQQLIRPEHDHFLFAHALIQEGVYSSLLKSVRRELHKKTADWFRDSDLTLRAEHLARAEDPGAPVAFLDAAAAQAREHRQERALHLTERGLAIAAEQSDVHALTCLKGELLNDLGRIDESLQVYQSALDLSQNDIQKCIASMGLAAGLRVKTQFDQAFEMLDRAQPLAEMHEMYKELSRIHHLRGNLCFPVGRIEQCRRHHQLALDYAGKADALEDKVRALGGLGDAAYAAARMDIALDYFEQCVALSRENGFGRIEAAYKTMIPYSRLYLNEHARARVEALDARKYAATLGHLRAEMNACGAVCHVVFDMGNFDEVLENSERGLELAHKLNADAWKPLQMWWKAMALFFTDDKDEGVEQLIRASTLSMDFTFNAGRVFGALAFVSDDDATRDKALEDGQRAMSQGSLAHNYLWFYRYAIDAMLRAKDWERAGHYTGLLEEYAKGGVVPWADFFVARGRALAAHAAGRSDQTRLELRRLKSEAEEKGLNVPLVEIVQALESG